MGEKVVLDTNILISSVGWKGNPEKIFEEIIKGTIELIISYGQFDEISRVLEYSKFDFTKEQKSRLKNLILEIATFVSPKEKITTIKEDCEDNLILESAIAGKADYIVSGDEHLLKLRNFRDIKILNARQFVEELKIRRGYW